MQHILAKFITYNLFISSTNLYLKTLMKNVTMAQRFFVGQFNVI